MSSLLTFNDSPSPLPRTPGSMDTTPLRPQFPPDVDVNLKDTPMDSTKGSGRKGSTGAIWKHFDSVPGPGKTKMAECKICNINSHAIPPSADTIREDVDQQFEDKSSRLRTELEENKSQVSLTLDGWTSPNGHPFIGITVHSIDA
ncbi:hypothetical protein M427DRAFT_31717 [Gonapodya prolifera JEL478]|uniref:BED-type domain-containing protein n=1 Tax=Gonapodya prolifera (strain JEL478) TaxID=1344416 RepID=A0A139AH79_GONPJ|nr:hypothetical protein M427DRAFT_31717 [Gonapodya prolifera JEL478]|eukprot:KXS16171.1 hypothetical protein M427DRAFT_31717 [Gonapodya prolifera JEL478]